MAEKIYVKEIPVKEIHEFSLPYPSQSLLLIPSLSPLQQSIIKQNLVLSIDEMKIDNTIFTTM
jgi:hypothetical protein